MYVSVCDMVKYVQWILFKSNWRLNLKVLLEDYKEVPNRQRGP